MAGTLSTYNKMVVQWRIRRSKEGTNTGISRGVVSLRIVTLAHSVSGGMVMHLSGSRGDHAQSSLRTAAWAKSMSLRRKPS